MARQRTYPKNKKSSKKKTSYKINDFHYRFDGDFKQSKNKHHNMFVEISECSPQNIHDIATNVFGKTYYVTVCEM